MNFWIDPTFASWLPFIGLIYVTGLLLISDIARNSMNKKG